MKCEIIIDKDCEEKVVVYAKENKPLIDEIQRLVSQELVGYRENEAVKLRPSEITCITVIGNKVYALRGQERYLLKERLYYYEERLRDFVKINQSCLANIRQMERFDTSISGTLKIHFIDGYVDYVSRRQLKTIKERIGI